MTAKAQETVNPRLMLGPGPVILDPNDAPKTIDGVTVYGINVERDGDNMAIDMTLDVTGLDVKYNRALLFTPCLFNEGDSIHLKSIGIYGRRRYNYYQRNNGDAMISGKKEMVYRVKDMPNTIEYHDIVPYKEWMDGGELQIHRYLYGCCGHIMEEETCGLWVGQEPIEPYLPEYVYVTPKAEVKTRSAEGSAYIDFPVNKTVIDPNYSKNPVELAKINATIDSMRGDKDVTITNIWLKGYASPEGSYSHNRELAIGRVNALKTYVQNLYNLRSSVITTANEPEDWAGLRKYVESSTLEHRTEILEMIDSNLDPDAKEAQIKKRYPAEYKHLLENCYPSLRHTDYRVSYTVRGYSDINEIKSILATQPQKLSLNEMYLVAQTLEPGSDEFNDVFETAVRMYPDDEVANLNAANIDLKRGDLTSAKQRLDKAGDSGEADYARGVLAMLEERYDDAAQCFASAKSKGVAAADENLEYINKNINR